MHFRIILLFLFLCSSAGSQTDPVSIDVDITRDRGPNSTGGGAWFLRPFLHHCLGDTNTATGKIGAPLDFVAFHAKGAPDFSTGVARMGMKSQRKNIEENFSVIKSFPEIRNLPVIIGESDPEGCAACGVMTNPENAYRNGTLYSSYEAASISRLYDMADHYGISLIGAVTWAFEFEDQPWFAGFRSLATNGVDKPVLNVFRMLGKMSGRRVQVSGDLRYDFRTIADSGVRGEQTDINALACSDGRSVTVLLWNYHDLDIHGAGSSVLLTIKGIPAEEATLTQYRIDGDHSNSYDVWKKIGSPQNPSTDQIALLERSGRLEPVSEPFETKVSNTVVTVTVQLARQAVSLLQFDYR